MTALPTPAFAAGPSLSRLFVIELRKTVDTRAGFWLLASSALLAVAVAVAVITLTFGAAQEQVFKVFFERTVGSMSVLLPVVGLLAITSEWSQRTAVATFALVPRRERVIAAKLLAALALALASVGMCLMTSVAANALVPVVGQGSGAWDVTASGLASAVLFVAMWMLAGSALGLLMVNSPSAIVLSFLIPTGIVGLSGIPETERFVRWIDLGTASRDLNAMHPALSGQEWAYLAAGVAIWVIIPLALGFLRLRRREVVTS